MSKLCFFCFSETKSQITSLVSNLYTAGSSLDLTYFPLLGLYTKVFNFLGNINSTQHFISCSILLKSHQFGKVLRWQMAFVLPSKEKGETVPSPQLFSHYLEVVSENGQHNTVRCYAALSLWSIFNMLVHRKTSAFLRPLPIIYLKAEGAKTGFTQLAASLLLTDTSHKAHSG